MRLFALLFAVLTAISVAAAEKELLNWNFPTSCNREFIGKIRGKYTFSGNTITQHPGSMLSSVEFPIRKGETIRVKFDVMTDKLTSKQFGGWGTVSFFDAAHRSLGHTDTTHLFGTNPWRHADAEIVPPGATAYFKVGFAHAGNGGTASFRNIHIYTKDTVCDELIADSDFEDILGVNYWFFKRGGNDWDHVPYFAAGGEVRQDENFFATGRKSLRLSGGGATLVSQEFPYDGELMVISGWIRTSADFAPAHKYVNAGDGGGVQLVALDAKGNHVAHQDLKLAMTPMKWSYFAIEVPFSSAAKKTQIFIRLFDGVKGTVWFDQLRLRRVPTGAVLPFNAKDNTLTIDLRKTSDTVINHRVWSGVDALFASWLLRPDIQQCLPYLKRAGIDMIRFREICNPLRMYESDNPDGTPNYDFTRFDALLDLLTKDGFIPNITIGTTPLALARPDTMISGWHNHTAPNDMKKWGKFIEAMFTHCVERYGIPEVNKWYWEIWNEPVLPATHGDYVGSAEDFVAMAMAIYDAADRVEAKYPGLALKTGMTSGGQAGASDEFLFIELAKRGNLKRIKHRSRHFYAGVSESIAMTGARIDTMREQGKEYGRTNYENGCTEWNCTAMSSPQSDLPWNAAMIVKMCRIFLDNRLDYSTFFAMPGHPELPSNTPAIFPANGGLSMFTSTNDYRHHANGALKPIPKPAYNAFLMFNELRGGRRLEVGRTADPVDALAVKQTDGTIRVLLTNYDEDLSRQPYTTRVTLKFTGTGGKKYHCVRNYACDNDHGNAVAEWKKLGKPDIGNREATDAIIAKALPVELPPVEVAPENDGFKVVLDLPSPGIRLLEFKIE